MKLPRVRGARRVVFGCNLDASSRPEPWIRSDRFQFAQQPSAHMRELASRQARILPQRSWFRQSCHFLQANPCPTCSRVAVNPSYPNQRTFCAAAPIFCYKEDGSPLQLPNSPLQSIAQTLSALETCESPAKKLLSPKQQLHIRPLRTFRATKLSKHNHGTFW